jgi:hypothetical protein
MADSQSASRQGTVSAPQIAAGGLPDDIVGGRGSDTHAPPSPSRAQYEGGYIDFNSCTIYGA